MSKRAKPTICPRPNDEVEIELVERGWQIRFGLWWHPRLATGWPAGDALRLQDEADNGRQDHVHRALRGEDE